MRNFYLRNFLGNPYDTGIAASLLMFSGVLDAYPKLDVVLPHAGGTFPWLTGRMDHGVTTRPEVKHMKRPPSAYLRRFYYDTCVYDPKVLAVLRERVGSDRLVMGSDYPVGEKDPIGWLKEAGLSGQELANVAGGNAARLVGIKA
jgi:aminocarboxymuconate-semialdehyde decarboxylase